MMIKFNHEVKNERLISFYISIKFLPRSNFFDIISFIFKNGTPLNNGPHAPNFWVLVKISLLLIYSAARDCSCTAKLLLPIFVFLLLYIVN